VGFGGWGVGHSRQLKELELDSMRVADGRLRKIQSFRMIALVCRMEVGGRKYASLQSIAGGGIRTQICVQTMASVA
jgi:hypothetical protein